MKSDEGLAAHLETRERVGEKLVSPSAQRNCGPIGQTLAPFLPENAHVLEIASGTGQHGAHMCGLRADIHWQMSDIDAPSRASQNAYALDFPKQMRPSLPLDMMLEGWWQAVSGIDVIYCANMIHIAPWEAALGLAQGCARLLQNGGMLCLYGPFLLEEDSAVSNLEFDHSLKGRNPKWGVRTLESVKHIFADRGLNLRTAIEMPRNNLFLVFALEPKSEI
ncbi:MAG: hypothetical protein COA69_01545 [Robiginitomaculum sp.]|nr:MAG: hypothetical protein COA69_01545 [Robiginitomaculum sp.]